MRRTIQNVFIIAALWLLWDRRLIDWIATNGAAIIISKQLKE